MARLSAVATIGETVGRKLRGCRAQPAARAKSGRRPAAPSTPVEVGRDHSRRMSRQRGEGGRQIGVNSSPPRSKIDSRSGIGLTLEARGGLGVAVGRGRRPVAPVRFSERLVDGAKGHVVTSVVRWRVSAHSFQVALARPLTLKVSRAERFGDAHRPTIRRGPARTTRVPRRLQ